MYKNTKNVFFSLKLMVLFFIYTSTNTANAQTEFISTWQTTSASESITIPIDNSIQYLYDVDWGDSSTSQNVTSNATHIYATPGIYTIEITNLFPRIYFNNTGDKDKILSVDQWGVSFNAVNMSHSFNGCTNLLIKATDTPDFGSTTHVDYMFANIPDLNVAAGGTIDNWNVSNVTSFYRMFHYCTNFNSPVGNWVLGSANSLSEMFAYASRFNQPLNGWNVASVTDLSGMFLYGEDFNQNLNSWSTTSVTDISGMFSFTDDFNGNISSWDVSNVTYMHAMFHHAHSFNQNINTWEVGNVTDMSFLFTNAHSFNQPLNMWNNKLLSVTTMAAMFKQNPVFNQDISGWMTGSVKDMSYMFHLAVDFNQDISGWDVSKVEDMKYMFFGAYDFNYNISSWLVNKVKDMSYMFSGTVLFNQDISSWKVDKVTKMHHMFRGAAAFDQDISVWNVAAVTNMDSMFFTAPVFDQNLGPWNPINSNSMVGMLDGSGMSNTNYDSLLIAWSSKPLQSYVTFGAQGKEYCLGKNARTNINNNFNWIIVGDSEAVGCVPMTPDDGDTVFVYNYLTINDAYTFPSTDGTVGDVMVTNGAGSLTWQNKTDNVDDADSDASNEIQSLSLSGTDLMISDGNSVDLSNLTIGDDFGNHTATSNISMNSFYITQVPDPLVGDDASNKTYVDLHEDADADPTNEAIAFMTLDPITYQLDIFEGPSIHSVDLSPLAGGGVSDYIEDVDSDTQVLAVDNSDDDYVGITLSGFDYIKFQSDINQNHRIDITDGFNTILGKNAGISNVPDDFNQTGISNTFIGAETGSSNQFGTANTFVGHNAGAFADSGANTFIGSNSGENNTGGAENTFVGTASGQLNDLGTGNTFIGKEAGQANVMGSQNTSLGNNAGSANTGGSNTFLGYQAGLLNDGSGNIFIGAESGSAVSGSNLLFIENSSSSTPLVYGDFSLDYLSIGGTLNVNDAYDFPLADGLTNQVLTTDGAGIVSWSSAGTSNMLADADGDTKIVTEDFYGADGDSIKVILDGAEKFGFICNNVTNGRLHFNDNGGNTYVGNKAGAATFTARKNTFLGFEVGKSATIGKQNVGIGHHSLVGLEGGEQNVAVGDSSLANINAGEYNTAIGSRALANANDVNSNTAVGAYSLTSSTTGFQNTAVGAGAMLSMVSDSANVAVGYNALYSNTSNNNTAIGHQALILNASGSMNTAIGSGAGTYNFGDSNTFLGANSALKSVTGTKQTVLGTEALMNNVIGSENTVVGFQALQANINGSFNTVLGTEAGFNCVGTGNVFLGYKAGHGEDGHNKLYISNSDTSTPLIYGDFTTGVVNIKDVMKLTPRTSAPASPQKGMMYFNDTTNKLMVWDGTTWQACW